MYLDDLELSMDMVSDVEAELQPFAFQLEQNYPNPFNPSTKISWQSAVSGHQTLKIYDVLGNEVATLIDEYRVAAVSYTHLRAHETVLDLVCRLLLEKKRTRMNQRVIRFLVGSVDAKTNISKLS